jgi:hypothetical protein
MAFLSVGTLRQVCLETGPMQQSQTSARRQQRLINVVSGQNTTNVTADATRDLSLVLLTKVM